jgi:hypothetical protein
MISMKNSRIGFVQLALFLLLVSCAVQQEAVGVDADINDGDAAIGPDAGSEPSRAARYPSFETQSPITAFVAGRIREIAANGETDSQSVAKVGDSITVSNQFFHCFANSSDSVSPEIDRTVEQFSGFDRTSLAAGVGWSSVMTLSGSPSPLQQEIDAVAPSVAVVMYGTNDAEGGNLDAYGGNLLSIVDTLIASGVVPIVSTIPPREYNANDARVPFYNAMARAVAQARQVPLVDLHRELLPLPGYGLGGDGLHPRGVGGGCDFSATGMQAGYNVRNRVTIEAVDRVRRVLDGSVDYFDESAPQWVGEGTRSSPYQIPIGSLPIAHAADTRLSQERHNAAYSCGTSNEGGSEVWYQLSLSQEQALRITVADRGDVDVDVHLLSGSTEASACVDRDDRTLDLVVPAGEHYLVVDTYISGGVEKSGEFLLTIAAP